jgi:hypothetical protein
MGKAKSKAKDEGFARKYAARTKCIDPSLAGFRVAKVCASSGDKVFAVGQPRRLSLRGRIH